MNRKFTRSRGSHRVKIKGQWINISLALIVYKCEDCLGGLARRDFGLVCGTEPNHRGFIHRRQAQAEAQRRAADPINVKQEYIIQDGQLVASNDRIGGTDAD